MPHYVEKLRVAVRLARFGSPPVAGAIALAPHAENHDGPETLLECLNAAQRVLPFELAGSDSVLLLNRRRIEWVEPAPDVEARFVSPATFMATREEWVRVRLVDGEMVEGVIAMEMPHEFNRASDYLNGLDDFFPLRTNDATRLINKRRVTDVLVRTTVPLPKTA
ncbi:MAG TPA: hypothetical protein VMH61_04850 [Candidatus Acidoferrales bacterium]|nr:hypothetical protein [Candidatus Acidoferrales bacterium]